METKNSGYIVVETITAFVMFMLLILSILSLINIVAVQARVHSAITQACETLSMYDYVLELSGAANHIMNSEKKADAVKQQADVLKENIDGLIEGIEQLNPAQIGRKGLGLANQIGSGAEYVADNPKGALQYILNYGLGQVGDAVFEKLVRPLVGRYLANGGQTGDEYLKSYGVKDGLKGLDFYRFDLFDKNSTDNENSTLLDKNGNVRIVVEYDIKWSWELLLPTDKTSLHVVQDVMTKAWLDGVGEGYVEK